MTRFPPSRRNRALTGAWPPQQTSLPFIPSSAFNLFSLFPEPPYLWTTWFLQSLGEHGVVGCFPSCRTLIAEMDTFAATSEQDVDRTCTEEATQLASSFCFNAFQEETQNAAMATKSNRTIEGQPLVTIEQCPCKDNVLIFISSCMPWKKASQPSFFFFFWFSDTKGEQFT